MMRYYRWWLSLQLLTAGNRVRNWCLELSGYVSSRSGPFGHQHSRFWPAFAFSKQRGSVIVTVRMYVCTRVAIDWTSWVAWRYIDTVVRSTGPINGFMLSFDCLIVACCDTQACCGPIHSIPGDLYHKMSLHNQRGHYFWKTMALAGAAIKNRHNHPSRSSRDLENVRKSSQSNLLWPFIDVQETTNRIINAWLLQTSAWQFHDHFDLDQQTEVKVNFT